MKPVDGKMIRENLGPSCKITVRLTEELISKVDKFAKHHNFGNRSWAVEELLRKVLFDDLDSI